MEPVIRSRKRKQRPQKSDPFGGIFTRSRSQIYFHRHRSGYARSDSNRSRNLIKSLKGTATVNRITSVKQNQPEDTVNQVTNLVSVKDLRARRVFSRATVSDDTEVDLEGDFDVRMKNDVNPNLLFDGDAGRSDLEVSGSVGVDLQASLENNVDRCSIRENDVMEAGVQMTPIIVESEENKTPEENVEMISVGNEMADTKVLKPLVTSLRGRRKVFKSPTSFNYRRLLPYLMDSASDDYSSFEITEATLVKRSKSSNPVSNMVALKDDEIRSVSNSSKLADGLLNNAKSCEKQFSNSVNGGLVSTVEGSDVKKSQEDVLNDALEGEQMTPPDSNIYSKSKIDDVSGVPLKPTSKLALKLCSRKKVLQTPTSFSHRRLLPFLMSVAEDYSCSVKGNQSLKSEKPIEQNQQPPTQSLLHQDEKSTAANETSNSPTSTLIPVDTAIDITNSVTLVSHDNILNANGSDKKGSEVNLLGEAVGSDSCIKMEQSPPKVNLNCIEETTSKSTAPCIEQSYKKAHQKKVKESPQQHLLQISETQGKNIKSGILKRTPRGCRGICNCLNCTSFRLHAERSFEFSRNQMHDAEEVALELINDLTHIRNILETTSSNSNSLDTVKEKQVKEACAKALYKEQEARARLAQMNEDLSIHCRSMNLLRPKVTFSNKIIEKVISKDEIYGKKSV